jgi:hypothetical protein
MLGTGGSRGAGPARTAEVAQELWDRVSCRPYRKSDLGTRDPLRQLEAATGIEPVSRVLQTLA